MSNESRPGIPGASRILAVECADGSLFYGVEGYKAGWEIPVSLSSLTPAELRAIADHKERLLASGFKNFC